MKLQVSIIKQCVYGKKIGQSLSKSVRRESLLWGSHLQSLATHSRTWWFFSEKWKRENGRPDYYSRTIKKFNHYSYLFGMVPQKQVLDWGINSKIENLFSLKSESRRISIWRRSRRIWGLSLFTNESRIHLQIEQFSGSTDWTRTEDVGHRKGQERSTSNWVGWKKKEEKKKRRGRGWDLCP